MPGDRTLLPALIAIDHDDYHAEHVGRLADGRQFFLTTPFVGAIAGRTGNEFVALYLFDAAGALLDARIDEFGPRDRMDGDARKRLYEQRLAELGEPEFGRIEIAPFAVERFGVEFGLIPNWPEDEDEHLSISLQPGDYMAFFEPWDSGDYDT
ncbi:hypothetical protein J5226_16140 [Lysobacter sp. K5869]|uniref:hypothetical protein n=1 Tax=Lysobacter sp. K5869 TaxID=2820808 RepID=UPI001C064154|nr:hypothetical protein [Lysobacter sp. K5869]QWP75150.1 hypothetical protein J5226_16140 [Lysobacter sp. K5869]